MRESLKKEMPLKDIACPKCGSRQRTEQMRLVTKAGFSNIMCKGCGEVSSSHLWRCRCQHRWSKCGIHLHNVDNIQRNGKHANLITKNPPSQTSGGRMNRFRSEDQESRESTHLNCMLLIVLISTSLNLRSIEP